MLKQTPSLAFFERVLLFTGLFRMCVNERTQYDKPLAV